MLFYFVNILILLVQILIIQDLKPENVKIIVLIIDSDNLHIYRDLRKIWKSYMHTDREHIRAYFLRANPKLDRKYKIDKDTIWVKTKESAIPGILIKTLSGIEAITKNFDFDYIVRTNLSSFYIFSRLVQDLQKRPRNNFLYSNSFLHYNFKPNPKLLCPHGCGYIISKDIANFMLKNKQEMLNRPELYTHPDDIMTCEFFYKHNIKRTNYDKINILNLKDWRKVKDNIPEKIFHFRVKHNNPDLRATDELYVKKELLKMFYNIIV